MQQVVSRHQAVSKQMWEEIRFYALPTEKLGFSSSTLFQRSRQSSPRRMVLKVQRNGITINTMQQLSTTIVVTNWTNPRTWYQRSVRESSLHTTVTAPDGFEGIKGDEL